MVACFSIYAYQVLKDELEKYRDLDWLSDSEIQLHLGEIDPSGPRDFNGMEIWLNDTYGILSDALLGYAIELEKKEIRLRGTYVSRQRTVCYSACLRLVG